MKHSKLCLLFAALLLGSCLSYELEGWGNNMRINLTLDHETNTAMHFRVYENNQISESVQLVVRTFLGPGRARNFTHLNRNSDGAYYFPMDLVLRTPDLCQKKHLNKNMTKSLYFCHVGLMGKNLGGRMKMQDFLVKFWWTGSASVRPELIPMAPKCNRTLREIGLTLQGSCLQNSLTKNIDTTNLFLNESTPKYIFFNCPSIRRLQRFQADWVLGQQQSQLSICSNQSFVDLIPEYEMSQCRVVVLFAHQWYDTPLVSIHVRSINTTYVQAKYIVDPAPPTPEVMTYIEYSNVTNATYTWNDTEYWNATSEIRQAESMARFSGYDPELVKIWFERREARRSHWNGTRKRCNGSRGAMNKTWRHGGWSGKNRYCDNCTMDTYRMMNHWHRHEIRKMRRHWRRHQRHHHRGEGRRHGGRHHERRHHHDRSDRDDSDDRRGDRHRGWTTPGFPGTGSSSASSQGFPGSGPVVQTMPVGPAIEPAFSPNAFPIHRFPLTREAKADLTKFVEAFNVTTTSTNNQYGSYGGNYGGNQHGNWKKQKCFKLIMIGLISGCLLCCVGICLIKCCKKRCCCRRRHQHHGYHQGRPGFEIVHPVQPIQIPTDTQRFGIHPFVQPDAPNAYMNLSQA